MPPQSMMARQGTTLTSASASSSSSPAAQTSVGAQSQPASKQSKILIPAIAAPVVIVIVLLGAILISIRRKFKQDDRRRTQRPPSSATAQRPRPQGTVPWYKRFASAFYRTAVYGPGGNVTASTTALQAQNAADSTSAPRTDQGTGRNQRQNRRRRDGVRRTDSGHSVKTLPEYRTALGEDEMMLYKGDSSLSVNDVSINVEETETPPRRDSRRSSHHVTVDLSHSSDSHRQEEDEANSMPLLSSPTLDPQQSTRETEGELSDLGDLGSNATTSPSRRESRRSVLGVAETLSNSIRRSMRLGGPRDGGAAHAAHPNVDGNEMDELGHRQEPEADAREELQEEQGPPSDAPEYSSLYPQLPPSIRLEDQPESPSNNRRRAFRSLFKRGGGAIAAGRTAVGQHQASASLGSVQSFGQDRYSMDQSPPHHRRFNSSASVLSSLTPSDLGAGGSSLSLSLQPSRGSMAAGQPSTSSRARSGSFGRLLHLNNSSASLDPSNDSSMVQGQTADGRRISSPLHGSLIRMQYEAPARGLTESQMSFLASVDSLGRFGMPVNPQTEGVAAEPPTYDGGDARPSQDSTVASPPAQMGAPRPAPLLTHAEMAARVERSEQEDGQGPLLPTARTEETTSSTTATTTTTTTTADRDE